MIWQFHAPWTDACDPRAATWSRAAGGSPPVGDEAPSLAEVLPTTFPAATRLFHPIWLDPTADDRTWDEVVRAEGARHALVSYGPVVQRTLDTDHVAGMPGMQRVWWRDLVGAALQPHTDWPDLVGVLGRSWPSGLHGPGEGRIELAMLRRLVDHVRPRTRGRLVLHASTWAELPDHGDVAHQVTTAEGVDDVLEFTECNRAGIPPMLWYPEDESWMVFTDEYSCATRLGGPRDLVEAVLADPELEAIPFDGGEQAVPPDLV